MSGADIELAKSLLAEVEAARASVCADRGKPRYIHSWAMSDDLLARLDKHEQVIYDYLAGGEREHAGEGRI